MPQRMSCSLGLPFFSSSAYADMSMPGVQNPHCSPCSSLNPSCRGWSCPSFIRPSTVRISAPSACTAKTVHDFTVLPLNRTVHAPQLLVSQPMWVPVSPRASRMKCTNSSLGSTAASRSRPLILTFTSSFFAICSSSAQLQKTHLLLTGPLYRPGDRPPGQFFDQTLLVLRRTAQVRAGLRIVSGKLGCLGDRRYVRLLAAQKVFCFLSFQRRGA